MSIFLVNLAGRPATAASSLLTSLVGAWELDEASGNAIDSHGSNDLTDTNTVGASGGWRDFEASNTEYFTIADNADLSVGGDISFTVEAWVQLESKASTGAVVGKYASGNAGYSLIYNQSIDRFYWTVGYTNLSSLSVTASSFGSPSTATVYQLLAWHDASTDVIGIRVNNGTANTDGFAAGGAYDNTTPFQIGAENGNIPFDGLIRRVRLWKRLLTSDERSFLYNSGSGRAYSEF